jgi:hypothetical protein
MSHVACTVVEVNAVLASAGRPFTKEYPAETPLGTVKAEILMFFGVREESVGGNQITYVLHRGDDKLTNMSATVGSLVENQACKLPLKVVKDLVFG